MSFLPGGKVNYPARIERAALLASRHSFAKGVLDFYGQVARFQRGLFERLPKEWGKHPVVPANGELRSEIRIEVLGPHATEFLTLIRDCAPAPLAAQAGFFEGLPADAFLDVLRAYWANGLHEWTSESNGVKPAQALPSSSTNFLLAPFSSPMPSLSFRQCFRQIPR
jgi:hypothetical protein